MTRASFDIYPYQSPWEEHHPIRLVVAKFSCLLPYDYDPDIYPVPLPEQVRLSSIKRQSEFLAGRACAIRAMTRLKGYGEPPGINPDRSPAWPEDIIGSITHSSGLAAAVVSQKAYLSGIGLDIELLFSAERASSLQRVILCKSEINNGNLDKGYMAMTLYFAMKESLFKCLYPITKRKFYFHDAEIVGVFDTGYALIRILVTLSPSYRAGSVFKVLFQYTDNFVTALALATIIDDV